MLSRSIMSVLAVCAGLILPAYAASAEPVFPPGLRIGLEPPSDMTVSKRFTGFEDAAAMAAITILDLPARAYQDIERSAFAQNQQGLADLKRESFPFASGIGILISGTAQEKGVTARKWFLLATASGDKVENLATLVGVQVPAQASAKYSDAVIRKALASVTFRPTPNAERLGMLPYKLDEMSGFRVLQVTPTGEVILIDGAGSDISRQAYMIISIGSGAPTEPDDRARFARNMLDSAPLANVRVTFADAIRITGVPGFEVRAQATGLRGDPVALVQWIRFAGSGYMRIAGVTTPDKWDAMFPRFRAVRDGISFR
jgi:hypothetical protein